MSAAAASASFEAVEPKTNAFPSTAPSRGTSTAVRRRANLQQGYALETLGHAVEYLVDSRLFAKDEEDAHTDQEAIQLLMRLSRAVFAECAEVIPMRQRISHWVVSGLRRPRAKTAASGPACQP